MMHSDGIIRQTSTLCEIAGDVYYQRARSVLACDLGVGLLGCEGERQLAGRRASKAV